MFLVVALAAAVLVALGSGARPASAAPVTFTVDTANDEVLTNPADTNCVSPSGCSLRAALEAADNRGADTTTINLPAGVYGLTLGALEFGNTAGEIVSIAGSGTPTIQQAAGCTEPALDCMVFFLDPNDTGNITVSISGVTILGGHTSTFGGGGGILGGAVTAAADTTTVSNCTITGNSATGGGSGGGISYAHGSLTVANCGFNANHAVGGNGGGIDFADLIGGSTLNVINSSFGANTSTATLNGGGGAIHLLGVGSTYTVTNTFFNGNTALTATAPGGGGAILKDSGTLTVTGSTFTSNSAGAAGAGGAINTSSDPTNLGDGVTPGLNRFAFNTAVAGSGQSLFRDAGNVGVVTAESNWWGTNTPNTSDAAKNVSLTEWFELRLSASPGFVLPGGATTLTGDLSQTNLNNSGLISDAGDPIAATWPGPTLGAISGAATQLDAGRHAGATYTAGGAPGIGTASIQVDGQTVTVNIPILGPITISKLFGGATVPLNGSTSLTFTLTNSNPITTITGIAFSDNLPAGLVVATPNGVGGTCVATSTATAGSSSITVSAVTLAGGASCTFSVNVTGTTVGTKDNTSGAVTSNETGPGGTAFASIDVLAPPSIAKDFNPTTIALNATSSLTFTITNPNGANALTGVAFNDTLPVGLTVPNSSSPICGGTLDTFAPGGIALGGAGVPAGGTCTFAVTVTGAASGSYTNTTGNVNSTEGGMGNTASANLTVASPPTITKSFGAASTPLNGSTSLNFTIANPNAAVDLTGVGFTDNLPAGLVVAIPNGLSGSCGGGTITAVAGSGTVSLSSATLIASAGCSFSVNVTGTTAGVKNNSVQVTSTEGGTGNTSNASITVVAPPVIIKAFGAASIPVNGSTSLTFTIQNNNTTTTLTGVGFSDTLPAGLVVATPNGLTGSCGGGSITATQGTNLISLSGASLAASSSCTFAVDVTGTAGGTQNNTTGNVTSTEGGTGGTASASIDVVAPPSIAKAFGSPSVPLNGTTSLTFTITNPGANAVSLTGVAFSDTLPAGLVVATPNGLSGTCGGGTITAVAGSGSISLSGATLAAGATCSFTVNITGTASGSFVNVTAAVTSTNGGTGNTASASLEVASPPTIVKSFGAASVALNGSTTLSFTINNPNAAVTLSGVGFTDNLPAGLVVATPNGLSGSCGGGTITAAAGASSLSLAAATLAPATSCTFSVNVTGTTSGVKNNSVQVTSTEGGTGNTSNASVTVVAPPVIIKAFGAASIPQNGSTSLTFTIQNNNTTTTLTGVGFSDTLPAGLLVATPNGLTGSCGGGSITATQGTNLVSLSGASLAASSSCTFAVDVTGTGGGTQNNSTGNVTSTEGGTGGTASASIDVVASPSIVKAFGVPAIPLNGTTSLNFMITNPGANAVALTGVAFSDTLPAGLVVATPNGLSGSCGGGTITAVAGSGSISLSGATLAAGATCSFTVNITGTASGSFVNVTAAVTSTNGGTGNTASASLEVASPPTIVKSFGAASVPLNGSTTLSFTINNLNTVVTLSGVGFTDNLPAGLVVATPNGLSGSCGGGSITAVAGASSLSLAAATLAPATGCTFSVDVTGTTAGVKNNLVQVTSTEGGTGNTSNASITVVAPPVIIKAFGAASIPVNGSTSLTFTIQNNNTTTTLTGVGFSDTLPGGLVVSSPNGQAGTCGGGTITAAAASNSITLTGASLAASSSCTFAVDVTGTGGGTQNNTTGNVTSTEGGTGGTAASGIDVFDPPVIAKLFGTAGIPINGVTSLSFTITNPAANPGPLTGIAFADTLPAGLVVANPNGLTGSCGGGAITAVAGSGSVSLNGATLASGTSCTIAVNVTSGASAVYANSATVTSTNGGSGNAAVASLTVANPPTVVVAFGAATVTLNGTTTITITITNPPANTVAVTGIGFTDNLPAGLVVANPNGLANTCSGASSAIAGSSTISLSGGTLAPASSCTLTVTLVGVAAGVQTDTVAVFSDQGLSGAVSASVDVLAVSPESGAPVRPQPVGLLLGLAGLLLALLGAIAVVARRRRGRSIR